ncbi:MAG TPA: hypothetical protein VJN43_07690 [Bryobacteraceae bacterium]|nr:hypothetical protein [Bryobacteraceae bacterium]
MTRTVFWAGAILAGLALVTPSATVPALATAYDAAFWKIWSDGQAELSGYDLTFPRYGHPRRGVAVTVFVTETFSNSLRVKADPGKHPATDEFPVMKLNLVKDFQTGVYDYNTMTSSFIALAPVNGRTEGSATKISFSSQEWCGQTYQQLLFDAGSIRSTSHSYFDGDADQQNSLDYPAGGFSEDEWLLWARGMAGPHLAPGERRDVRMLRSLETVRLQHVPDSWMHATLSRSAATKRLSVPAGSFQVETYTIRAPGGTDRTIYVEAVSPHRIVRWETSAGERADLLGSQRMKYWQMNGPGYESALKKLGLSPRPPRTT